MRVLPINTNMTFKGRTLNPCTKIISTDYSVKVEQCKTWLKANLNSKRYEHSLGVAECAEELAKRFGLNSQKAYLAGLTHDCAKCLKKDTLKAMIKTCSNLSSDELANPNTYHAPAGAILAKNVLGITDGEILSSIRWHTVGNPNMTDFEKIIFIADKIETKTRSSEITEPVWAVLNETNGLDKALLLTYQNIIVGLSERGIKLDGTMLHVYAALNELYKK